MSGARMFIIALAATSLAPSHAVDAQSATRATRLPGCSTLASRLAVRHDLAPAATQLVRRSFERHDGEVVRWVPRADTVAGIQVWVEMPSDARRASSTTLPDSLRAGSAYEEQLWSAVVTALDDWSNVTPGVRFALAADSSHADVSVVWLRNIVAEAAATDSAWTAGRSGVERSRRSGEIASAFLILALADRHGRAVSPREVHAVAVHEVGHLLGLAHSSASEGTSAMTAIVSGAEVTAPDSAALRVWYSMPLGRACAPPRALTSGARP